MRVTLIPSSTLVFEATPHFVKHVLSGEHPLNISETYKKLKLGSEFFENMETIYKPSTTLFETVNNSWKFFEDVATVYEHSIIISETCQQFPKT